MAWCLIDFRCRSRRAISWRSQKLSKSFQQMVKLDYFSSCLLITPLCKGQATEERHISSEGGRGGNPKSEFWYRSTVQILRKSWRHFTCKVYAKNCLCRHHYWIQIKNMSFLWVVVMLLFEWLPVRIKVYAGDMTSFASDVTLPQPDKAFLGLFRALFLSWLNK